MNTKRRIAGLAVALAMVLGAGGVQAQGSPSMFGVAAAVDYGFLGGDDFDLLDGAIGFEALGSLAWPGGLEVGVGVGIASHDIDPGDASADLTSVFGEGRYRFGVPAAEPSHLHPFVAGRVGYANLGVDPISGNGSDGASGLLFGFGGGVEYWLSESVAIEGAGMFNLLNLEDDVGGTKLGIRAGGKVRF